MRKLPPAAVLLGAAGLLPFVGCGLAAVAPIADADRAMAALLAYGAVILAFLGAVHWGFVLGAPEPASFVPARRDRVRLALGVAPALVGWVALLMPLVLNAEAGVAVLIAGHLATVVTEAQARRRGLMPPGYMWLRWALSGVVLVTLVTVLTLRLLGARMVF